MEDERTYAWLQKTWIELGKPPFPPIKHASHDWTSTGNLGVTSSWFGHGICFGLQKENYISIPIV